MGIMWALLLLPLLSGLSVSGADEALVILVLSQENSFHRLRSEAFKQRIAAQQVPTGLEVHSLFVHEDFSGQIGGWAVTTVLEQVHKRYQNVNWVFVCEEETRINLAKLHDFLRSQDSAKALFVGHALFDRDAVIIHHFAFAGKDPTVFKYPDFAAGLLLSAPTVQKIVKLMKSGKRKIDFVIDAKHELAMLLWEDGKGLSMQDHSGFCTSPSPECISYPSNEFLQENCNRDLSLDDVFFAVKTCYKFHKDRVVVVKRTWALEVRQIEYYSDEYDAFIPTVSFGIKNTERGHCGKTFAILERFASGESSSAPWLVIADDDTLFSIPRLMRLLRCYDSSESVILGERYGYGFTTDGEQGYDYPTGGSGMIFSRKAVNDLLVNCRCPSADSPDDMIIGMCARNRKLPILHSAAFHQARPQDYAVDYLSRLKPISFHKHWECDPYKVYIDWLHESNQSSGQKTSTQAPEIHQKHHHYAEEL